MFCSCNNRWSRFFRVSFCTQKREKHKIIVKKHWNNIIFFMVSHLVFDTLFSRSFYQNKNETQRFSQHSVFDHFSNISCFFPRGFIYFRTTTPHFKKKLLFLSLSYKKMMMRRMTANLQKSGVRNVCEYSKGRAPMTPEETEGISMPVRCFAAIVTAGTLFMAFKANTRTEVVSTHDRGNTWGEKIVAKAQ